MAFQGRGRYETLSPATVPVDIMMRTTLTLEKDVALRLKTEMRRSGRSLKETVNDLLRVGLENSRRTPQARPFRVRARPLGLKPGLDYDNIGELLEQVEGPGHR